MILESDFIGSQISDDLPGDLQIYSGPQSPNIRLGTMQTRISVPNSGEVRVDLKSIRLGRM